MFIIFVVANICLNEMKQKPHYLPQYKQPRQLSLTPNALHTSHLHINWSDTETLKLKTWKFVYNNMGPTNGDYTSKVGVSHRRLMAKFLIVATLLSRTVCLLRAGYVVTDILYCFECTGESLAYKMFEVWLQ